MNEYRRTDTALLLSISFRGANSKKTLADHMKNNNNQVLTYGWVRIWEAGCSSAA